MEVITIISGVVPCDELGSWNGVGVGVVGGVGEGFGDGAVRGVGAGAGVGD